jgi:hypothetical protein
MLISLVIMTALSCPREPTPLAAEEVVMTDTAQDPNPYRLPFSREEYIAAQTLVRPRAEAERLATRLFTRDPNLIGVTVMDGDYVLVALLSTETAERMIAARPRLAELIRLAQANCEEILRSYREGLSEGGTAP